MTTVELGKGLWSSEILSKSSKITYLSFIYMYLLALAFTNSTWICLCTSYGWSGLWGQNLQQNKRFLKIGQKRFHFLFFFCFNLKKDQVWKVHPWVHLFGLPPWPPPKIHPSYRPIRNAQIGIIVFVTFIFILVLWTETQIVSNKKELMFLHRSFSKLWITAWIKICPQSHMSYDD